MNIWASDKHFGIKHLMLLLADEFQPGAIEVKDSDELDPGAIRLCNPLDPHVSIYIFIYGQETDRYGAHIEYPDLHETEASDTIEMYESIDYETLADLVQTHLELRRNDCSTPFHTDQKNTAS